MSRDEELKQRASKHSEDNHDLSAYSSYLAGATEVELEREMLEKDRDRWRKEFIDLETHRAICCSEMEIERDRLRGLVGELRAGLETYSETHVWCMATMLVIQGDKGFELMTKLGAPATALLTKLDGEDLGEAP